MTLPSTDVIQLTLALQMTAQVVATVLFSTTFTQTAPQMSSAGHKIPTFLFHP